MSSSAVEKQVLWAPNPGRQEFFMSHPANIVGFGGAVGGGKTDAMLFHHFYLLDFESQRWMRGEINQSQARGIYFRRLAVNLSDAEDRFLSIVAQADPQGMAGWNASTHTYKYSCGMKYRFAGMEKPRDYMKFSSFAFTDISFDELTECLPHDTDVLTDSGWKAIGEVQVGDSVFSISKGWEVSFKRVTKLHAFDYDGPLVSTNNKHIRFAVTPNHRMVIGTQHKDKRWEFRKASELPPFPLYPFHIDWNGKEEKQISCPPIHGRGIGTNANVASSVDANDWLEFLGWYMSEGSKFISGKPRGFSSPRVSIAQTKPAPDLDALMKRLPWRSKSDGAGGWSIFSRQLFEMLPNGNCKEKRVPRWIMGLCKPQLKIFFDAFARGDGHRVKKGGIETGGVVIGLANEGLIDDLQEIAARLGRRARKGFYLGKLKRYPGKEYPCHTLSVYGYDGKNVMDRPKNKITIPYKGTVRCLTVEENHTFLCRYQGRMFWSGNCEEEQFDHLFTRIRSSDPALRQFFRMSWASNPIGPGLAWVRRRFIAGKKSDVTYVRTITNADGSKHKISECFIQAYLKDNPKLAEGGEYEAALRSSKPHIANILLHGDWWAQKGNFLGAFWDNRVHIVKDHRVPKNVFRFRSCDFGIGSHSSITWWYVDADGCFTAYHNLYLHDMTAPQQADRMREVEEHYGDWNIDDKMSMLNGPLDAQCFKRHGASGPTIAEDFRRKGFPWRPSAKDRFNGLAEVCKRLGARIPAPKHESVISTSSAKGMIRWMERCKAPIEYLPIIPADENNPGEVLKKYRHLHTLDDTMFACMTRPIKPQAEEDDWDEAEVRSAWRRKDTRRIASIL